MKNSESTRPLVSRNKISAPSDEISHWLVAEMEIAGRKDLPIHIDTDIEDDDDPFQKQPKHFLITAKKREMMNQDLEERKEVHVIRRFRRAALQKRKDLVEARRKKRAGKRVLQKKKCSFANMPPEMILEVIRHTRLEDLPNFLQSGRSVNDVFRESRAALPPSIEVTQFAEFSWLFGSNRRRSAAQSQALVDFISSYEPSTSTDKTLQFSDMSQKGQLSAWRVISALHAIKDMVTSQVQSYNTMGGHIEMRSALYLDWISSFQYTIMPVNTEASQGDEKSRIMRRSMPMQEQIEMFEKQPATIQVNIRDVLERTMLEAVGYLARWEPEIGEVPLMGQETMHWIREYYGPDKVDHKMKREDMRGWIGGLAAGYLLDFLLSTVAWSEPNLENIAAAIAEYSGSFADVLQTELENSGSTDEWFKESRMFAACIGLNVGKLLEGTVVEDYLETLKEQNVGAE